MSDLKLEAGAPSGVMICRFKTRLYILSELDKRLNGVKNDVVLQIHRFLQLNRCII